MKDAAPRLARGLLSMPLPSNSAEEDFRTDRENLKQEFRNRLGLGSWIMTVLVLMTVLVRGLVRILFENELVVVGDGPLLNGLFGVSMGKPVPGNEHLTVIVNLIASNSVMQDLRGDIDALPSFCQPKATILNDDENLLWSCEDMVGCSHLFRLPDSWSLSTSLSKPQI